MDTEKSFIFVGHFISWVGQSIHKFKIPKKYLFTWVILNIIWNPWIQVSTNMSIIVKLRILVPTKLNDFIVCDFIYRMLPVALTKSTTMSRGSGVWSTAAAEPRMCRMNFLCTSSTSSCITDIDLVIDWLTDNDLVIDWLTDNDLVIDWLTDNDIVIDWLTDNALVIDWLIYHWLIAWLNSIFIACATWTSSVLAGPLSV